MTSDEHHSIPAKWRYIPPNAITGISLLIGLSAIYQAVDGHFINACWLTVLCVLLDKLDGTVARLLKATSSFGLQLDSLADFVTFGIAPAITLTLYMIDGPGKDLGGIWSSPTGQWFVRLLFGLYVLCTGLRLAKFNVMAERESVKIPVFYGMPTTYAGGLLVIGFLLADKYDAPRILNLMPVFAMIAGLMMVSNLPLPKIAPRRSPVWQAVQMVTLIFAYYCGVTRKFPEYLFALSALYGVFGFAWGFHRRQDLAYRPELANDEEPNQAPQGAEDDAEPRPAEV